MTYYEILIWTQENIVSIQQNLGSELFHVKYFDEQGAELSYTGTDLISIVLAINEVDLVVG